MTPTILDMERGIARCRMVLATIAILAVYVDPTQPSLTRWLPLTGGLFEIDPLARLVMGSYLVYSLAIYAELEGGGVSPRRLAQVSTWIDVAFGAAIALVTEGATSPFSMFFAFAVITAGLRTGLRATLVVTAISAVLYLTLILVSGPEGETRYLMRPAYIAITGYLAGYLGQQRLNQEARIRELEANVQRERIARSLHDGYAQALAGVNLRLETFRELYRRGSHEAVMRELTELQTGVNREHDELREYIRSLIDREPTPSTKRRDGRTQFAVRTDFRGTANLVEEVLRIMLEGTRNIHRHAHARSAVVSATHADGEVVVTIDDDGAGFPAPATPPWSIASRVADLGGRLDMGTAVAAGARLTIRIPTA